MTLFLSVVESSGLLDFCTFFLQSFMFYLVFWGLVSHTQQTNVWTKHCRVCRVPFLSIGSVFIRRAPRAIDRGFLDIVYLFISAHYALSIVIFFLLKRN